MAVTGLLMDGDRVRWATGRDRLKAEARAVYALLIVRNSINWKGISTLVAFTAWAVVWVGMAFQRFHVVEPLYFAPFTLVLALILGRWWGVEVAIAGIELKPDDNEDD